MIHLKTPNTTARTSRNPTPPSQPLAFTAIAAAARYRAVPRHGRAAASRAGPRSLKALEAAIGGNHTVIVAAQRHERGDDVAPGDIYHVGVQASLLSRSSACPTIPCTRWCRANAAVRILDYTQVDPFLSVTVEALAPDMEMEEKPVEVEALMRTVRSQFEQYAELSANVPSEVVEAAKALDQPGRLANAVANIPDFTTAQRQELLEIVDAIERLAAINRMLAKQLEIAE